MPFLKNAALEENAVLEERRVGIFSFGTDRIRRLANATATMHQAIVKALVHRSQRIIISQVPLAETAGFVAVLGEHVRDRHFIGMKTVVVRRKDHVLVHRDALRIAPGQERGA